MFPLDPPPDGFTSPFISLAWSSSSATSSDILQSCPGQLTSLAITAAQDQHTALAFYLFRSTHPFPTGHPPTSNQAYKSRFVVASFATPSTIDWARLMAINSRLPLPGESIWFAVTPAWMFYFDGSAWWIGSELRFTVDVP